MEWFKITASIFCAVLSLSTQAWNATGHMLVAEVSLRSLDESVQKEVNKLVQQFSQNYPKINNYVSLAVWNDDIKGHGVRMFNSWHYIDYPFSDDGSNIDFDVPYPHAEWAIQQNLNILKNKYANSYEKSLALAMVMHIIGDIHQPLHGATRVLSKYPKGDKGGNLFKLSGKYRNLHSLWDSGLGWLKTIKRPLDDSGQVWLSNTADELIAKYPEAKNFTILQSNEHDWAQESLQIAKSTVYKNIYEKKQPSVEYIDVNKEVVEKRIAIAGFRLGNILNCIFHSPKCVSIKK